MLYIIKDGKRTGTVYDTDKPQYRAHHEKYGETAIWLDGDPTGDTEAELMAQQQAEQAAQAADPTSSLNAFANLRTRLHAADASFQDIITPDDLLGALPRIISTIQAKIDAKDALIATELAKDTTAGFKQAITLMQQRNQLTDGYNTIQSWALALVIRKGAGR